MVVSLAAKRSAVVTSGGRATTGTLANTHKIHTARCDLTEYTAWRHNERLVSW